MESLTQDEFYRQILAGDIPDGPWGEPPFCYERMLGTGTSRMMLFGTPLLHFKIVDQLQDGFLVSVKFDEALPIQRPGAERTFPFEALDIDELHQALEQHGEQDV